MSNLYHEAAGVLCKLLDRKGGLKSLAYQHHIKNKRSSYALVCETLKYKEVLDEIINTSKLFIQEPKLKSSLALVYISLYDFLFSTNQKIKGGGFVKKAILKHFNAIRTALVRIKIQRKVIENIQLLPQNLQVPLSLPRYARINLLKSSQHELDALVAQQKLPKFTLDDHVANIIKFSPGTELHEFDVVRDGKLILQDKASCFPAFALFSGQQIEGDIIDACAAPGNKTSHLAMLASDSTKVFAFDRSPQRLDLLKNRMVSAGAQDCVVPSLVDFLKVDPNDSNYTNVQSILLDPSCSGSGMANRLDHLIDQNDSHATKDVSDPSFTDDRIESLADFQKAAILKAFTFPSVTRVVYSTCSIYQAENEAVVASTLKTQSCPTFHLVACLPNWTRRGMEFSELTSIQSNCLVRASPEDGTNGFFVAVFERDGTAQQAGPSKRTEAQKQRLKRKRASQKSRAREKLVHT